ncbi:hypothetical protein [Lunatibacter salilacus]|uniref:hypothetical protein n=1 Tax=Lunatibacter salilacus TaxID=2483804 RepID=UPI00131ADF4B|nr:hypothetical protein [Lunatibacter salilacus]
MKKLSHYHRISFLNILIIISLISVHFSCVEPSIEKISCEFWDECPEGLTCYENFCVDPWEEPCEGIQCHEGQVCYYGSCFFYFDCEEDGCPAGTICYAESGLCAEDPCTDITCPEGMACYEGVCSRYPICNDIECPEGSLCFQGECFELRTEHNPCAGIECQEGEYCYNGICYNFDIDEKPDDTDACFPKTCPLGWYCEDGECKPRDQRWLEPLVIGDPWFILEGIVLDSRGIGLGGVEIFVQNRLTPMTTTNEGEFSVLIQKSQNLKFSYPGQNDIQIIANPETEKILIQFK